MDQIQEWGYIAELSLPGPKSHPEFRSSISVSNGDNEIAVIHEFTTEISLYRTHHPFDGKAFLSYEDFSSTILPAYLLIPSDPNLLSVVQAFLELEK